MSGIEKINILNFGEAGSGKSSSIATLLKSEQLARTPNIEICFLCVEKNSLRGIREGIKRHGIELKSGQLRYMVCTPDPKTTVSSKQRAADFESNYQKLSEKEALEVKATGESRAKYNAFVNILKSVATYMGTDMLTGEVENLGDYLTWPSNRVFVIDSLTSTVDFLFDGVKAARSSTIQADWNVVQQNLMSKIIVPLTDIARCSVIFLGHPVLSEDPNVKQPRDPELRIKKLYPRSAGHAINSVLMSKFTEVFYSWVDNEDHFFWAGKKEGIATSVRSLPRKARNEQDYSKFELFLPE